MTSNVAALTDAAYKGPVLQVSKDFYGAIAREVDSRVEVDSLVNDGHSVSWATLARTEGTGRMTVTVS